MDRNMDDLEIRSESLVCLLTALAQTIAETDRPDIFLARLYQYVEQLAVSSPTLSDQDLPELWRFHQSLVDSVRRRTQ